MYKNKYNDLIKKNNMEINNKKCLQNLTNSSVIFDVASQISLQEKTKKSKYYRFKSYQIRINKLKICR